MNAAAVPTAEQHHPAPLVGVVMGSASDFDTMAPACDILHELGVPYEARIVSAHRTPDWLFEYAEQAADRGLRVIIAGAGGAAHLPGMIASATTVPVIGVPIALTQLDGMDSLLSIVQMPSGVPVATVGIGQAKNAGLLALRILSTTDESVASWLEKFSATQRDAVLDKKLD
jgi:5-(carboxyamino)imidazole ribonucleotide mutase